MSKYTVTGPNDEPITTLNANLAMRQKITDEQLEALKLSHQLRWMLFESAKKIIEEDLPAKGLKLRMLANVFDTLESEQQKLWNFDVNSNFHMFWTFPGCSCPVMDNQDRIGTPYKVTVQSCIIHGVK